MVESHFFHFIPWAKFVLISCLCCISNLSVPSKAPSNFTVTANTSTVIIASWQLPSPDSRHGIIRGLKIFFRKKGSDNRPETSFVYNVSMYTIPVTGLAKFTEYEFHVLAFASAGDGMNSSVHLAKTKEDSKLYCLN